MIHISKTWPIKADKTHMSVMIRRIHGLGLKDMKTVELTVSLVRADVVSMDKWNVKMISTVYQISYILTEVDGTSQEDIVGWC